MLKIKRKVNLHNKFHLVLTDSRTGRVKQEAYAYNIILDRGLALFPHYFHNRTGTSYIMTSGPAGFMPYIHLGVGTGTLDTTREQLFDYLDRKIAQYHDRSLELENAYHTRKAVWSEAELQNESIKEVGVGQDAITGLNTHALIEDSEGNPITVEKGQLDVLTVYATVFVVLEHSYDNEAFKIIKGSKLANGITHAIAGNASLGHTLSGAPNRNVEYRVYVGKDDSSELPESVLPVNDAIDYNSVGFGNMDDISSDDTKVMIDTRFAAGEANVSEGIREIGVSINIRHSETDQTSYTPIFRSVMPLPGVWTGKNIEGEEVGTGDDAQTEFELQWGDIVSESETIYVDEAEKVKDTDYTINYETGVVTFATAPADGLAVTADYSVEYIPKDENHVLDVKLNIEFADGGQGS